MAKQLNHSNKGMRRHSGLWILPATFLTAFASAQVFAAPPPSSSCEAKAKISPDDQIKPELATPVTLNGQPSSPNTGITYLWKQTAGTLVTLSSAVDVQPTFTAPAVGPAGETLTFKLTVTGCSPLQTSSITTNIYVTNVNQNQTPVAAITVSPPAVYEGYFVTLSGATSTDPDGDTLSYLWEQTEGVAVTLDNANTVTATFTAPTAPYPAGTSLKFKLTVSDGTLSGSTTQIVNVLWQNDPPVAHVACPSSVNEGAQFTLDGSGSSDPDDGIASYSWTQTLGGPVAELPVDLSTATIDATAPFLTSPLNEMKFKLEVKDVSGLASSAECTVKVNDITPPTAAPTQSPSANAAGWNNTDATVSWNWVDEGVGIDSANCTTTSTASVDGVQTLIATCQDLAGNAATAQHVVNLDKTKPTIDAAATTTPNADGWYKDDVTVGFSCADALSGILAGTCPAAQLLTTEGAAVSSTAQTVNDNADNTSDPSNVVTVKIDKTAPGIVWSGSINPGDAFYWGYVPAAPTCTATDSLSGPKSCGVTGYSIAVGDHVLTATAYDTAGNKTEEMRSYTVKVWTLKGFYQPVDMGGVWNTVKGGSTVPLKFEVFAAVELTDVSVISGFTVKGVACPGASAITADIELTTTGGTLLRYDAVAGQFIQNWQTPKLPGACYMVTMTTDDGSSISANFKLK